MAITSSAGDGVRVTTAAKSGTVKSFTGGKVRLEDPITTGNNGNLEASPVYTNRLILIDGGTGVDQIRFITGETLSLGDGDDADLDVSEPWTIEPDSTSTFQISYVQEDADTLGGANISAKTGVLEMSRELSIGSSGGGGAFAFFFMGIYQGLEGTDDNVATQPAIIVEDNGHFQLGYLQEGIPVSGAIVTGFRNSTGEDFIQFNDGAIVRWYASIFRSWLTPGLWQQSAVATMDPGSVDIRDCVIVDFTDNMEWRLGTFGPDMVIQGQTLTAHTLLLEFRALIDGMLFTQMHGFESLDDGLTEEITVRNINFISNDRHVVVHDDKAWNFINAQGWVADSTFIEFEVDDLNEVNKKFSLEVSLEDTTATVIARAILMIYEGTTNLDLPPDNKIVVDFAGEADSDVLTDNYTDGLTITSFGEFALRIYKYGKTPILAVISNDDTGLTIPITMVDDPSLTEAVQAQAVEDAPGVTVTRHATGETDPRPINVIRFVSGVDGGDGAPSVGDVISGAGGATGEVIELLGSFSGNGFLVLETRNATAYVDGEVLTDTTQTNQWTANADTTPAPGVDLDFTWLVDGATEAATAIYDYLGAKMATRRNPIVNAQDGAAFFELTDAAKSDVADAFRYLPVTPVAADAIYFGDLESIFEQLTLNVSTAGTGGSGVWEYWDGTSWTALSGVTDGTNGFTTSGENDVDFTLPTDWAKTHIIDEFSAAQVWQVDASGPTFVDETTDFNSAAAGDVLPFPATEAVGDYFAIASGSFGPTTPFQQLRIDTGTAGASGGVVVWEYWNGTAWALLPGISDGTNSFSTTGFQNVTWDIPGDWKTLTLGGSALLYYVRARLTTVYDTTNPILNRGFINKEVAYFVRFRVTSAGSAGGRGRLAQIDSIFETVVEWGEDEQSQLMFSGATGFFTNRNANNAEGVWIANRGAGAIDFFTDDAGTTFTPPVNRTYTLEGLESDSEVRIFDDPSLDINLPGDEINGVEDSGTSFAHAYQFTASQDIIVHIFHLNFKPVRFQDSLENADKDVTIFQIPDPNFSNP